MSKFLALSCMFLFFSTDVSRAELDLYNFKEVLPGVLYRGGGEGEREPLSHSTLQTLCNQGFESAVYVYNTGWQGEQNISCASSALNYSYHQWDSQRQQRQILEQLYDTIQNQRGPMYVHCWYGVHASGLVAAISLMQFCGYSGEQAVQYWNEHVPRSIQYARVQNKIRAFEVYPDLRISSDAQARVCPQLQ